MLPRADAQPPTRRLSGEFDTEQLITCEAAEAEESSEDESDEKMAAVRFTSESQGGGNSESSSSHESHGIIGQIDEMLTLKLSSCPHLDDERSLTYKHLGDLSREEISQLLGET